MRGYLVNDTLGCIEGSQTFWQHLLDWFPGLEDQTRGYTPYDVLPQVIANLPGPPPDYVIRNATFFPPLRVFAPTASFLQDVLFGQYRDLQLEVCKRSKVTVVNSLYTAAQYPELRNPRVIPIGVDHERFNPDRAEGLGIPPNAICFIGSSDRVKGFAHVQRLIATTDLNFVLVMKDDAVIDIPGRVVTFTRVTHLLLAHIINACAVGFCPSIRETQHLAGIEMGFCGLPLVTSDVGVYYQRPAGVWGLRAEPDEYEDALKELLLRRAGKDLVSAYWRAAGFTLDACRSAWTAVVEELCSEANPDYSRHSHLPVA